MSQAPSWSNRDSHGWVSEHQVIDEKEATILCLIAPPVTADNSDTKGMHIRR